MANDRALELLFGRARDHVQIIDADAGTRSPSRQQSQVLHACQVCPKEGTKVRTYEQTCDMSQQVHSVSPARAPPFALKITHARGTGPEKGVDGEPEIPVAVSR